jgi:hypothetical protein
MSGAFASVSIHAHLKHMHTPDSILRLHIRFLSTHIDHRDHHCPHFRLEFSRPQTSKCLSSGILKIR